MIVLFKHDVGRDRVFLGQAKANALADEFHNFLVGIILPIACTVIARVLFTVETYCSLVLLQFLTQVVVFVHTSIVGVVRSHVHHTCHQELKAVCFVQEMKNFFLQYLVFGELCEP